jgi:hypothetical protein
LLGQDAENNLAKERNSSGRTAAGVPNPKSAMGFWVRRHADLIFRPCASHGGRRRLVKPRGGGFGRRFWRCRSICARLRHRTVSCSARWIAKTKTPNDHDVSGTAPSSHMTRVQRSRIAPNISSMAALICLAIGLRAVPRERRRANRLRRRPRGGGRGRPQGARALGRLPRPVGA